MGSSTRRKSNLGEGKKQSLWIWILDLILKKQSVDPKSFISMLIKSQRRIL